MRFGLYASIGVLVVGILTCITGAAMYTVGSYGWAIPGQVVHRCGMFVFFAGLIGLLASASQPKQTLAQPKQTPRAYPPSSLPQVRPNEWRSPSPRLSLATRATLGGVLFAAVVSALVGLSQLVRWMGR